MLGYRPDEVRALSLSDFAHVCAGFSEMHGGGEGGKSGLSKDERDELLRLMREHK